MPRKWKDKEYEYQQGYIKENLKFVNIPFNTKKPEDMELYEHLEKVPEKKAAYIKRQIREDITKESP